jgi:DNA polymerase III subunit gamma/tau
MLNLIDDEIYFKISDAVLSKDYNEVFRVSGLIFDKGYDFGDFLNGLIEHFRNILTVILSKTTDMVETAEVYKTRYLGYIDKLSEGDILRILNFLNKTQQEMRFSQNHRLKIEIALSQLIGFERSLTITELLGKIESNTLNSSQYISRDSEKKSYNQNIDSIPAEKPKVNQPYFRSETIIEPAKKEPLKVTLTGKNPVKEIPSKEKDQNNTGEFSFDSIVKKWDGFVSAIMTEKRFILGPYIGNLELIGLEGNKLKVFLDDSDGKKSFNFDRVYLEKKTAEIFGKKILFQFEDRPQNSSRANEKRNNSDSKGVNREKDPLIDLIISELGGEEISG